MEYTITLNEQQIFTAAYITFWVVGVVFYALFGILFTVLLERSALPEDKDTSMRPVSFLFWPMMLLIAVIAYPLCLVYSWTKKEKK